MKRQRNSFLAQVISGAEKGWAAGLVRLGLGVLEPLYRFLLILDRYWTKPRRLPRPVFSVGNLTAGGTGKTPTVIWLVKKLLKAGYHPAVLTRGYGGKLQRSGVCLHQNDLTSFSAAELGDEPYLLARLLPQTMIAVGRDRYRMGLQALRIDPAIDCFILDDGLQHWGLARELDLVLLDATNPFGNGHLIPRGLLREPVTALKRAQIVLLTRSDKIHSSRLDAWEKEIQSFNPEAVMAVIKEEYPEVISLPQWAASLPGTSAQDFLKGRKVAIVTAIGNPSQFLTAVSSLGAQLSYYRAYPDHYLWKQNDLIELAKSLKKHKISELIVTAKDGVKLEPFSGLLESLGINCYILSLEFKVTEAKVWQTIKTQFTAKGAKQP